MFSRKKISEIVADYLEALRLFDRNVRLILVSMALFGFTFFGVFATLFNLYLLRLGLGPEFIGLINGVAGLTYGFSCLPAGVLGRRLGARRVMTAGMGMLVIGLASASLTDLIPAWQRGWVLATYILAHLGFALYFVNIAPVLMAFTDPQERDHVFSTEFALLPLGAFVGSLAGGLLPGGFAKISSASLDNPAPYRLTLLAASLCLTSAIWTLWAVRKVSPQAMHKQESNQGTVSYALFVVIGLFYLLWMMGEQGIRIFFNVYLDASLDVPTAQIGVLLAASQLLSVPAALVMPLLSARWGQEHSIVVTALGMGLSILAVGLIPHRMAAGLGYVAMAAMAAITRPAIMAFSQRQVVPEWRSVMSGSISMIAGLGTSAASTAAGYVVSMHGYGALFLASSGIVAAGVLLFWGYFCALGRKRVHRCQAVGQ